MSSDRDDEVLSDNTGVTIIQTILGTSLLLVSLTSFYFLNKRYNVQPIKYRKASLVMITWGMVCIHVLLEMIIYALEDVVPCEMRLVSSFFLQLYFSSTLVRFWGLFFAYKLTQQKLNYHKTQGQRHFYIANRFLAGPMFSNFIIALLALVGCSPLIYDLVTKGKVQELSSSVGGVKVHINLDDRCPISPFVLKMYFSVVFVVYAFFLGIFLTLLSDLKDAFSVKTELRGIGSSLVAVFILFQPFVFSNAGLTVDTQYHIRFFITLLFAYIGNYFTCWYPWLKSRKNEPELEDARENNETFGGAKKATSTAAPDASKVGLKELLRTYEGREAFEKFLQTEFSVENLLFYDEARALIKKFHGSGTLHGTDEIRDRNQQVFQAVKVLDAKYLGTNAPLEVNVNSRIKQEYLTAISVAEASISGSTDGKITNIWPGLETAVNDAIECIFLLMQNDSFRRFKKSDIFKEFLGSAGAQASLDIHAVEIGSSI